MSKLTELHNWIFLVGHWTFNHPLSPLSILVLWYRMLLVVSAGCFPPALFQLILAHTVFHRRFACLPVLFGHHTSIECCDCLESGQQCLREIGLKRLIATSTIQTHQASYALPRVTMELDELGRQFSGKVPKCTVAPIAALPALGCGPLLVAATFFGVPVVLVRHRTLPILESST